MNNERFLSRIGYKGDFSSLLIRVSQDFNIGTYHSSQIIPFGYEDLNVMLETDQGKFFAKLFASFRSQADCERYVTVLEKILEVGVSHPNLYKSGQGHVNTIKHGSQEIRVAVMEYIDGQTFFELADKPNESEGRFIIAQAAKINSIAHKPPFVYDSWAVSNFLAEYEKKKYTLDPEDSLAINPLIDQIRGLAIDSLPHTLVHGDIISTNVMRDRKGKIFIVDFAVSNWYPRIQELAVLLSDLFFDSSDPEKFRGKYNFAVEEYQRHIPLTSGELKALPLFVKAAHSMHIIGASYERSQGNTEAENNSWLELGKKGLKLSEQLL